MPEPNLAELRRWQKKLAGRSAERDRLTQTIASSNAELRELKARISELTALGDRDALQVARAAEEQLEVDRRRAIERRAELDIAVRDILGRGFLLDPGDADPELPLLLLPVRLETRFTPDGSALRVRIYPDDVHIDSLDRGVTDPERSAAIAYWTRIWRASAEEAGTAWREFVGQVGKLRVYWVAQALRPTNLASRNVDLAPVFPTPTKRTRQAATARLLPDAFTVVVVQGNQRNLRTGQAVLPQIPVGLFGDDGSELVDVGGVQMVDGAKWLADYAEAERIGMGVTVQLPRRGARVDRVLVFGVRQSLDPKAAAAELSSLFESHRSTQGLAFVLQGTPTNNTETDRAGWQGRIEPQPPSEAVPDPRSNAAVLAAAFGVNAQTFAGLDHGSATERARAMAMNVALWNPSWGGFLDKVNKITADGATLSDAAREETRRFHRDFVHGRGPLPAVRIGRQPYGILPVSCGKSRWMTDRGDTFEAGLLPMLERLRNRWRQCLFSVPRIGEGSIDDTLRELLGSSPVCLSLRVRPVLSEEVAQLAKGITDPATTDLEIERLISEMMFEEVIANASLVRRTGSLGESRPLALPLVHATDPAFIDGLLAGSPTEPESVLQALLILAWNKATRDVEKDDAGGRLAEIIRNAAIVPSSEREKTLAVAIRADTAEPATLFAEANRLARLANTAAPTHIEFQPVAAVARSFGELAVQASSEVARAQLSLYATLAWLNSRGRFNELRDALREIKSTTLDERRILVAESLDIASHRLDVWITAVVERRRRALRAARPEGITIGAFGWVEGIEPTGDRQLDGGFIHAPSMMHAATAGVLRSAYLSHNPDGTGSGAFAIDLSSARVRTALHLVDGVRHGQPLGALLGYRIERRLHESQVDRFILSLRNIAPLTQGKLTDRGQGVAPEAVEVLAASNVVDGVDLIEKYQGKVTSWSSAKIRAALDAAPKNNPYLTSPWSPTTAAEWQSIAAIIEEAEAALDATGDLLLAESVHQLIQGNSARAAAALDAASAGDSPPPEPDVIATPASGMPFTHRLMIVAGGSQTWNVTRPRSAAEPRLEAWAAARLGVPEKIVVANNPNGGLFTLADTGFCALDVVYDSADRAAFADRVRAALKDNVELHDFRQAGWAADLRAVGDVLELAASLRALLVGARPAVDADFVVPNAPATRPVGQLIAAQSRAQAARDLLALRCTIIDSLLTAGQVDPISLRPALENLAAFGLATPIVTDDQLRFVAEASLAAGHRRLQNADAALAKPVTSESVGQAGQAIFGDGFWILSTLEPPTSADGWNKSLGAPPLGAGAAAVRTYLTDLASVRDCVRRWLEATILAESVGTAPSPRVTQIVGVGGSQPTRWIGGPLPLDEPTPSVPVVSTVIDAPTGYDGTASTAALVVDEWVDVVPIRQKRGKGENAPIDERQTTGVTFNAMAPSARAPQTMLLAVSPDGARWTADAIVTMLEETLELAQLRAVTLERTNGIASIIPALYEQSWSLQGEPALDFKLKSKDFFTVESAPYVREVLP